MCSGHEGSGYRKMQLTIFYTEPGKRTTYALLPQVSMESNTIVGLKDCRWYTRQGDDRPSCFILLAEQTGMINPIGEWA